MYLSGSKFLANLTPQNKRFFKVKPVFKFLDHTYNLLTIKKVLYLEEKKLRFFVFCLFKQLLLKIKQKFEFLYHLIDAERLLSVVGRAVSFSADKSLDFHNKIFSVSPSLF